MKEHELTTWGGPLIICIVLAGVFHTWSFAYFTADDFYILFWAGQQDWWQMLSHNLNPMSDFFRPFGVSFYWIFWHVFGLTDVPYHLLAWALHAANVFLLYHVLASLVQSRLGAATGAILFAFRANFADIYWNVGTIFELLTCLLFLLSLVVISRRALSWRRIALLAILYVIAIKSKEMAISLPAVLMLFELCLRQKHTGGADTTDLAAGPKGHTPFFQLQNVWRWLPFVAIGLWFVYLKLSTMGATTLDHPYYMDFSILTFGRGYGWYFDRVFDVRLRWGAWAIMSVLTFAWLLYRRERRGLFFLGFVFITLLPVIFLVNHRYEFYWYVPFFGVAGLAAVAVDSFSRSFRGRLSYRAMGVAGVLFLLVLAVSHYRSQRRLSQYYITIEKGISDELRGFVPALERLPQPVTGGTIYFKSFPNYFNPQGIRSATHVALRRWDIRVEIVEEFPANCDYCLRYENATLFMEQTASGN